MNNGPKNTSKTPARKEALLMLESFESTPTSLMSYQSNGRVIALGDEHSLMLCKDFSSPLKVTYILMTGSAAKWPSMNVISLKVISLNKRAIDIQGYLGNFSIKLTDGQGDTESLQADLIVDFNAQPLIRHEMLPPGYLHETITEQNNKAIESQLIDMTGEFEKPKYFSYDESICAHGVNGQAVCTNCIDACPAGAISSLIETIEIDPFLCQGGGTCSTVCPSGAIQYVYPRLTDSGNQLRKMLQVYREQGGDNAVVMFHAGNKIPQKLFNQHHFVLPLRVEELASVGMELILSALVYGASQVVLLSNDDVPELSLKQLHQQIDWLQSILSGLALDPLLVSIQQQTQAFVPLENVLEIEPALYSMPDNKRSAIFQALDHLYQQIEKTRELITLPAGAPFGAAMIDEKSCTLCMACVGACPGKALQDGSNRELPELFFIESNCIQCGACTQTCPEQAISISPRFVFNREKRNRSRVLNRDTPFACIGCGKPFAPTSLIHKMTFKLKDHYMFKTSRALDRLKMCDDCRVADIVQDPEAFKGSFDPLNSTSGKRLS